MILVSLVLQCVFAGGQNTETKAIVKILSARGSPMKMDQELLKKIAQKILDLHALPIHCAKTTPVDHKHTYLFHLD